MHWNDMPFQEVRNCTAVSARYLMGTAFHLNGIGGVKTRRPGKGIAVILAGAPSFFFARRFWWMKNAASCVVFVCRKLART